MPFITFFCNFKQALSPERISKIKNATVLLTIEGTGITGSGFFIDTKGTLLTCFHVIKSALVYDEVKKVPTLNKIVAKFNDGREVEYTMNGSFVLDSNLNTKVVGYDFVVLIPRSVVATSFLKLGSFLNAKEGEEIYTSGYPLKLTSQFISKGIISTKYIDSTIIVTRPAPSGKVYKIARNQALLDITLNSGNSGGAIIKIGKSINEDEVIGIADFIITPISPYYEFLKGELENSINGPAKGLVGGIDPVKMLYNFVQFLGSSSVGISGCVSIDHVKDVMGWK